MGAAGRYSSQFREPSHQEDASTSDPSNVPGVPDVAFDANPSTGVYASGRLAVCGARDQGCLAQLRGYRSWHRSRVEARAVSQAVRLVLDSGLIRKRLQ